jgi:hypothetical protein
MRTEKHIAASRLNGRKSSARIVAANLKSGVYAESTALVCSLLPCKTLGVSVNLPSGPRDHEVIVIK